MTTETHPADTHEFEPQPGRPDCCRHCPHIESNHRHSRVGLRA